MKNNKKGFTLIELLAVIVILAIIMVIAVPQILKVIDESRTSSWKNSVKMVERSLELQASLIKPENNGASLTTISSICSSVNSASTQTAKNGVLASFVDLGDMNVTGCATATNTFSLSGTGQFGSKTATIVCNSSTGSCTSNF